MDSVIVAAGFVIGFLIGVPLMLLAVAGISLLIEIVWKEGP